MSKVIDSFSGEYDFLSNFYNCPIVYDGLKFNNSEAAYHSVKCPSRRAEFINLNASEAKKLGRKVGLRPDWEEIKDNVMYAVCYAKFSQNKDLKIKLLQTGNAELIEGNYWNDIYWGVCKGTGQNKLGKILMKIREEFKQELDLPIPTKHNIDVGDSYLYYFDEREYNKSICLVQVTDIVNETSSRIKFLQIFEDNSGNNLFKYLLESDQTMVVSNCYLHPVHIINEQKKHIELLSQLLAEGVSELEKNVEEPSCSPFDSTPADRVFPVQINLIESNSGKKTFNIQVGEYDYAYDAENLKQAIEMFDRNICEIQLD